MSRYLAILACALGAILALAPQASAENSPIIRDCSLGMPPPAVDPDFVLLSGGTLKANNGALTVLPSQKSLDLVASESVDQGDSAATVALFATVKGIGVPTQSFFATAPGFVIISIPLNNETVGQVYTISWNATFDNGQHTCPSAVTLENTTPIPYVVKVVAPKK
jgi:hypothetical protein